MTGQIRFQYSCERDVVTAYVDWQLQTPEDLEVWALQYDTYFKGRFPHKVRQSPRHGDRHRTIRRSHKIQ